MKPDLSMSKLENFMLALSVIGFSSVFAIALYHFVTAN